MPEEKILEANFPIPKKERDRDWTPKVLALLITASYVFIQYHLITHVVDPSMREMVMRSLGTLDSLVGIAFGYYFIASYSKSKQPLNDKLNQNIKE